MVYQSKAIHVRELPAAQPQPSTEKKGGRNGLGYSSTVAVAAVAVMRPVNSNVIPYGVCSYMYIIAFFSKEEERKKG
jgi:hypothetical protein